MNFWKRLFRRPARPSPDSIKTAPLDDSILGQAPPVRSVRRMVLGAAQSTGIERTHNEDALFYLVGRSDGQEAMPDFGLFVVADGMGGHRAGEVAKLSVVRQKIALRHVGADTSAADVRARWTVPSDAASGNGCAGFPPALTPLRSPPILRADALTVSPPIDRPLALGCPSLPASSRRRG